MLAKGKCIHRKVEYEVNLRQILGLTNRNCIKGIYSADKLAKQSEVQYCPNPMVQMQQIYEGKVAVLNGGGLARR